MQRLITSVQSRRIASPKTVLGFYAGVLAIVDSAALIATGVLSQTHTMTWLIPWILGFAAVVFVLLVGGVFAVNLLDPAKLMLGQISGSEYVAIQSLHLGDSLSGERDMVISQQQLPAPQSENNKSGAP
jgi:hypothetical protein